MIKQNKIKYLKIKTYNHSMLWMKRRKRRRKLVIIFFMKIKKQFFSHFCRNFQNLIIREKLEKLN